MITVILYAEMGRRFGRRHKLDINTPAEALRALQANHPGFRAYLWENRERAFRVLAGTEALDESALIRNTGRTIKFIPLTAGAGNFAKIILGAALIYFSGGIGAALGGSFGLTAATITGMVTNLGFSLILGGISGLLFKPPTSSGPTANERPENKPSYVFDGAVNTTAQGNAVPVLYGESIVGSQVISSGLSVEQLA